MSTCRRLSRGRAIVLPILVCAAIAGPAAAQEPAGGASTKGDCSPVVVGASGEVTINVDCRLALNPKELEELRQAVAGLSRSSERLAALPADLLDRHERLSRQFGVQDQALQTFFRILNEENVPVEELDEKLREIAGRHRQLLARVAELDAVDEKVAALRDKARAAVERGDYTVADAALKEAQAAQDGMLAQAEKPFLVAAELRARRAELKETRFRHGEAAELYLEAADLVPGPRALEKAGYLLKAGEALQNAGRDELAQEHVRRALALQEEKLGRDHQDIVGTLRLLARISLVTGRGDDAEPMLKRALAIAERGEDPLLIADVLDGLAAFYTGRRRFAEAEPLYKRALKIREDKLGKDHLKTAYTTGNLAVMYKRQMRYEEAKPLFLRVLAVFEAKLGPDHVETSKLLGHLAGIYIVAEMNFEEAGRLLERALLIQETQLGKDHVLLAFTLEDLARVRETQARYEDAQALYERALAVNEARYEWLGGNDEPKRTEEDNLAIVRILYKLAILHERRRNFDETERLLLRAVALREGRPADERSYATLAATVLADLYEKQKRFEDAERLLKRALAREDARPSTEDQLKIQTDLITLLRKLAGHYVKQGRHADAEPLLKRALAIQEARAAKLDDPLLALAIHRLAGFYMEQGRDAEAEPLLKRALAVGEARLADKEQSFLYSDFILALKDLASVYAKQGRLAEAEPLLQRALKMDEARLARKGEFYDESTFIPLVRDLAAVYVSRGRHGEAEALLERALTIHESHAPYSNRGAEQIKEELEKVRAAMKRSRS